MTRIPGWHGSRIDRRSIGLREDKPVAPVDEPRHDDVLVFGVVIGWPRHIHEHAQRDGLLATANVPTELLPLRERRQVYQPPLARLTP
jgi:hypothetical protein